MKKKVLITAISAATAILILAAVLFALVWNGIILLNGPYAANYEVRGVDVSAYQGDIDWSVLSDEGIKFAFIKATEGSSFVDRCFSYNYEQAKKSGLYVGAYHFFSYDSGGDTQADNFIKNVEGFEGMLPPVIDLEFYGDKESNPPERSEVTPQLQIMLDRLEEHYGMKPIIYATEHSYELYLSGDYEGYDIWIRNVITKPKISDGRQWTFWQYTNRGRLRGYKGEERFIDINVFGGTLSEFLEKYGAD